MLRNFVKNYTMIQSMLLVLTAIEKISIDYNWKLFYQNMHVQLSDERTPWPLISPGIYLLLIAIMHMFIFIYVLNQWVICKILNTCQVGPSSTLLSIVTYVCTHIVVEEHSAGCCGVECGSNWVGFTIGPIVDQQTSFNIFHSFSAAKCL